MSDYDADYQMLLQEMAGEYLDESWDRLEKVELCIDRIKAGLGKRGDNFLEIKREIHSVKGGGTPFGFSSISHICHSFESFLESSDSIDTIDPIDLEAYFLAIKSIVNERREPDEKEKEMLLKSLPTGRSRIGSKAAYVGSCLIVMPKNLQRKIIAQELAQLGLKVALEEDPISAINTALDLKPEYIVTSKVIDRLSGAEVARIFRSISEFERTKVAILTASDQSADIIDLPKNCSIIQKGPSFAREVFDFFDL
tara:strand:- start:37649 stop:38410 length:762 start_codon:yes stop_codon:yes gene_type:complete